VTNVVWIYLYITSKAELAEEYACQSRIMVSWELCKDEWFNMHNGNC